MIESKDCNDLFNFEEFYTYMSFYDPNLLHDSGLERLV